MPLFDEISGENYGAYAQTGLPLAYLFVDPADPKKEEYIKELTPVAAEQKNKINFVWIDATKFADHAKTLALKPEWPAFVIQGGLEGQDKFPFDQTQEVSATNVAHFVKQFANGRLEPTLKSEPVPEEQTDKYYRLVGSEFEKVVFDDSKDVFVQFSAPWCGHCKRLAPTWEELGEKYADIKDRLVIAKMDGTENDLPSSVPFRIAGFPTLKFKPAGSRDFIDYEGDRSLESLVEFVEQRAKNSLVAPPKSEGADTNASAGRPAATPAATHQEL
jgi:protein disulfide-isomerase A1